MGQRVRLRDKTLAGAGYCSHGGSLDRALDPMMGGWGCPSEVLVRSRPCWCRLPAGDSAVCTPGWRVRTGVVRGGTFNSEELP